MVSSQARALPPAKPPMPRKARKHASCATSSASARLPVSQRASAKASARCGSTTLAKRVRSSSLLAMAAAHRSDPRIS
jgi:hypothetical protein